MKIPDRQMHDGAPLGMMKNHCEEGKILCEQFEDKLKDWGFADVDKEAAERIIGNFVNPNLKDICNHAKEAQREFLQAKQAYVVHVADCLVCSRTLVVPA
jgi:hypothetical protein